KAGYLYQVNPITGELREIGPTGFAKIEGLSFKADGTLWAWATGDGLIKVDIQTGKGQLIFPSEIKMEALTWTDDEILYLAQGTDLWTYDGQGLERTCDLSHYTARKHIDALEIVGNSLLVGMHEQPSLLELNALNLKTCFLLMPSEISTEHNEITGIAYAKGSPLMLGKPGIWPDSLEPGIETEVRFALNLSGTSNIPPLYLEEITLEGPVKLGQLYDDGTGGDIQANDYNYGGQFSIQKMAEGEYCYRVRSAEKISGFEKLSVTSCLWVVSFPNRTAPSEVAAVEKEIIVKFTEDTSLSRIKEILISEGVTVDGHILTLKLVFVRVESEPRQNVITRLEKYHEVKSARPNRYLDENPSHELAFPKPEEDPKPIPKAPKPILNPIGFESALESTGWAVSESCFTTDQFGQFAPTEGEKFLVCTTFPNGKTAWIKKELDIPYDVTSLPIRLDYNVISQEYPTLKDAPLLDTIRLSILRPDGKVTHFAVKVGNLPMFEETLHLPEGDLSVGQTGWQTVSVEIPVSSGKGFIAVMMYSENDPSIGGEGGEGNHLHSALLVDNIRFVIDDESDEEREQVKQ
ncbi:MAG: hypothetical protein DRR19_30955, partial [Candidatus Parabeggiatoa sp. nov. 1]